MASVIEGGKVNELDFTKLERTHDSKVESVKIVKPEINAL